VFRFYLSPDTASLSSSSSASFSSTGVSQYEIRSRSKGETDFQPWCRRWSLPKNTHGTRAETLKLETQREDTSKTIFPRNVFSRERNDRVSPRVGAGMVCSIVFRSYRNETWCAEVGSAGVMLFDASLALGLAFVLPPASTGDGCQLCTDGWLSHKVNNKRPQQSSATRHVNILPRMHLDQMSEQ
jgi:hypothetical protein